MAREVKKQLASDSLVFALDIGTRSIIGVVGTVVDDKLKVLAIEQENHNKRAMIDGQIEDIDQVARIARTVKERLEAKLNAKLTRVCVAAAGRALVTQKASYEIELPDARRIDPELIGRLEAGAIGQAEAAFNSSKDAQSQRQFFLVGYSVQQYYLDNYNLATLKDHHGKKLKADVIATFLPSEVVDSLYTAMQKIHLEVASLTLEPIAAINAAIPQDLRLLNLVLVDIGAGTSDIAACRDGSIVGYTMATLAGDEITETLMKEYLTDFSTAEKLKFELAEQEELSFTDILGFEQTVKRDDVLACIKTPFHNICQEIAQQITEVNNGVPSAVFLAGGGSKLTGMREAIAEHLNMDMKRVALAGNNFRINAFSDEYDLNNPEYATPLGIAVSAGLNLINDSFRITLNGKKAKLFRSGILTVMDILMMNGYGYQNLMGRSGQNITVHVDGERKIIYGERFTPAILKLNDKEVSVTDVVQAGDSIEFQPAIHGKHAQATLSDVVEPESENVMINGVISPLSTPIKTGDDIQTEVYRIKLEREKLEEEAAAVKARAAKRAAMEAETVMAQNPVPGSPEDGKAEHITGAENPNLSEQGAIQSNSPDNTQMDVAAPAVAQTAAVPPAVTQTDVAPPIVTPAPPSSPVAPLPAASPVTPLQSAPARDDASPAAPIPAGAFDVAPIPAGASSVTPMALASGRRLNLTLNGSPLSLPEKPDGGRYYLMDLLEYSGLDFDHISGQVVMTINGTNGSFLQELRNQDNVVITCEERD